MDTSTWFSEISKPGWLISAILAGLLGSLFSDLFKKWGGRCLALFSEKWSTRSEYRRNIWEAKVNDLAENPEKMAEERHREIKHLVASLQFSLFAVLFVVLAVLLLEKNLSLYGFERLIKSIMMGTAIVVLLMGVTSTTAALGCSRAIQQAKKLRDRPSLK